MKATSGAKADFLEALYKAADGEVVKTAWSELDSSAVIGGRPWRTFPWYLGQRNYSGLYWCATERAMVGYESRLELSRLMMADFDSSVKHIGSQPFQLRARLSGERLLRVPDYLLATDDGPLVIDVTRAKKLEDPEFRRMLDRTRHVIESRGWRYEIANEPPKVEFLNIRFLSGYRREWLFAPETLSDVRESAHNAPGRSISDIVSHTKRPKPIALASLMHLLWRQEFKIDLTQKLSPATTVRVPS
jgi:hypothetical protein